MKLIKRIEETIKWDKPINEQLHNLQQFDNLSDKEILDLSTYIKSSEAGILIEYLGFEKLYNYLPNFIQFLQDANWPAAGGAAKMLVKAKEVIIPEIKRIFKEEKNDAIWHYWILVLIIEEWDSDLVKNLKNELIELIKRADQEGASIESLKILKEKELLTEKEFKNHYNYLYNTIKNGKYEIKDELLRDLRELDTCL